MGNIAQKNAYFNKKILTEAEKMPAGQGLVSVGCHTQPSYLTLEESGNWE